MDTDVRPVIVLLFVLDGEPDQHSLLEWHKEAARRLPRMAARVVQRGGPLGTLRWEPDPSFDPARHIRRLSTSGKGTHAELLQLVEGLAQTPFIPGRPLWECYLIDALEGGRSAYVLKISHAIADGLRLRDLFLRQSADQAVPPEQTGPLDGPPGGSATTGSTAPKTRAASRMRRARDAVRFALLVAQDMRDLPPWPVGTGDGVARRYLTLDLPMEGVRAAARAGDGTVQDALVAGLAEGIHRYYTHSDLGRSRVRVFSPYGRAPLTRHNPSPVGNHWFIVRFDVPAPAPDLAARVRAARSAVRRVYRRDALDWMGGVARMAPFLPAPLLQVSFRRFTASHDFIISNIPGSRSTLRIAGVSAEQVYGIAPSLGAAFTATTVSYRDACHVTINIDPAVVGDVELLGDCLRHGLEKVACRG
ncbi:wax ester/triacylglycerol synthase domain-containing protein [Streptomyces sp. NPDC023327]|uniref:wax ester/triacylglycerol synthase domain-containing protein n=1 Tax=Streptomyces sp. NPDC023327 TaxID=3157088 RepID=UPI0033E3BC07